MVFTTEVFLEVAIEGWPEWDLKVRLKYDQCKMKKNALKMVFWDETQEFSETPAFSSKSTWESPKGHSCLDLFLNTNYFLSC